MNKYGIEVGDRFFYSHSNMSLIETVLPKTMIMLAQISSIRK